MYVTSSSISFIFLRKKFFLYFFAPLFAKLDFAVFPDAFPLYNIWQKKENQKEKKKHLAYFSL